MSETTSVERILRSRPVWFWVYAALILLALFALMFVVADRLTEPATTLEPIASETAEPENDFLPADRPVSECISAVPKPGCGSEARGGWRQGLVLLAILAGLALIAWRIVRSARQARQPNAS